MRNVASDGAGRRFIDLPALAGDRLARLPWVLRLLLENVARTQSGSDRDEAIAALLAWPDRATSLAEIPVQPGRVLMHDTTSTPALVDIAAMRDSLAEHGVDPASLNPCCPWTSRSTTRSPSRLTRAPMPPT
jgi:aconitate hydratase